MNPTLAYAAACLLLALVGVGAQSYYWTQIADDSFIFFRYASNFAAGEGLRWNSGQPPVEGFSSPLWVLLLGAAKSLGAPLLLSAKVMGLAAHTALVLGIGSCTRRLTGSGPAGLVSMLAALLCDPFNYWAPSGMETSCYIALLTWAVWALLAKRPILAALLLSLTALARPEAPGLVLVALLVGTLTVLRCQPPARLAVVAAITMAPLAAYLMFRVSYFGELLPNTYYAKIGGTTSTRLANGLLYIAPAGVLWLGGLLGVLPKPGRQGRPGLALILALATAALLPPLWSGGDWMWHRRFLCPALPCLLILATVVTTRLLRAHQPGLTIAVVVLALTGLGWVGMVNPLRVIQGLGGARLPVAEIQEGEMTKVSREVAEFLRSRAGDQDLVAVNHAGALPFYSGLPTLDMTGLNDHHIAHLAEGALHGKFDVDYVLAARPRFVVLNAHVQPNSTQRLPDGKPVRAFYYPGYWAGETALVQDPRFFQQYRFLTRYWTWDWAKPRYIVVAQRIR